MHVFAAFDSSGAPAAGVAAHRSGTCWTSSITVAARGAYRCFAGDQILDPCFAAVSRDVVDCYGDPWSKAVELTLKSRLPTPGAPLKISQPWALELAGGNRCVATTGTTDFIDQVAMRYQCRTGIAGLSSTSGPVWQALYQDPAGAHSQVPVAAVWTA